MRPALLNAKPHKKDSTRKGGTNQDRHEHIDKSPQQN